MGAQSPCSSVGIGCLNRDVRRMRRRTNASVAHVLASALLGIVLATLPVRLGSATADVSGPAPFDVTEFGAIGSDNGDDTAAFASAIQAAGSAGPDQVQQWTDGPGGLPQSVVVVPPGTYRLFGLRFVDNVRLEVDAGAVLEPTSNAASGPGIDPVMISWDSTAPGVPLRNVSIVGTGFSAGGLKAGEPIPTGWDVGGSVTFNLDPAATGAGSKVGGMTLGNVTGFLVAHVLVIQNDSRSAGSTLTWPMSGRAAIVLKSNKDSPIGGPYLDPHQGTIDDVIGVHEPRGFGPIQVNSAHDVSITKLRSRGGTALRLETDDARGAWGAEINGLTATTIEGLDCNRAVSFAPHGQVNQNVTVTDVHAIGCAQGVIESKDEKLTAAERGSFLSSSISDVYVQTGKSAQLADPTGASAWTVGDSMQVVGRDPGLTWAVTYDGLSCLGPFTADSPSVSTAQGWVVPPCGPSFAPKLKKLTPNALAVGRSVVNVTLVGQRFSPDTRVSIDGDGVTVNSLQVISDTTLAAKLSVDPSAMLGRRTVTVANSQGSSSCEGCLTINPIPTVSSTDGSSITRGTSTTLTIHGDQFVATPKVQVSGSGVAVGAVTFLDAQTLTVPVTVQATAALGARTVSVTNAGGGTGSWGGLTIES